MLVHLVVAMLAVPVPTPASGKESSSAVEVRIDAEHREVVVTAWPIHIPEATLYHHHPSETYLRFQWPVRGWVRGYRLDLLDSGGRTLPREMLHHAGVANLDRRQLPYPLVERLLAVGRETRPVMLPASIGVPLAPGQQLLLYYALANATASPIDGASLRLSMTWTPEGANPPHDVFPLFLDANPKAAGADTRAFDVPPGLSIMSAEFTLPVGGRLRALGGHLHDYAVEIRLEDVRTGKTLARLTTKRHTDGRLIAVTSTRFVFKRGGLHLAANHQYRVIAVYDNPTSGTILAERWPSWRA
ncbi:MAG TPA: hypothetical protein VKI41_04510, partial [Vicinamibacteria bacterium]|nr:hypothetical protein [Vicinamibacteria bacterium]